MKQAVVSRRSPREAFSPPASPGFNLCGQWHPEWKAATNPISMRLFRAFGDACRTYHDRHTHDRHHHHEPDR